MKEFPADIVDNTPSVRITGGDALAVYVSPKRLQPNGPALYTSHCLEAVLLGERELAASGRILHIKAGEIQFCSKGSYYANCSRDYTALLFFIEDAFILDLLANVKTFAEPILQATVSAPKFPMSDVNASILLDVKEKIEMVHQFAPCITRHSLQQIFFQLFADIEHGSLPAYLLQLTSDKRADLRYLMEKHFLQSLALPELAALSGRSLSAFKKDFAASFNSSPFKWLLNRRLQYADYLLRSTSYSVAQVAYMSCFENVSHFSKCYRAKYGLNPLRRRKAPENTNRSF